MLARLIKQNRKKRKTKRPVGRFCFTSQNQDHCENAADESDHGNIENKLEHNACDDRYKNQREHQLENEFRRLEHNIQDQQSKEYRKRDYDYRGNTCQS